MGASYNLRTSSSAWRKGGSGSTMKALGGKKSTCLDIDRLYIDCSRMDDARVF